MQVPVLRQGPFLIATVQAALTDLDLKNLQSELLEKIAKFRSKGVILDVAFLDVIDSFASRTLRSISETVRLRGANLVLVGIQPDVAFAMVQMGLTLSDIETALDLEEGLEMLLAKIGEDKARDL